MKSNAPEIWKLITNAPGYDANNYGYIRSYWTMGKNAYISSVPQRILKGNKDSKGYLQVTLYNGSGKTIIRVHKIIADLFLGPCLPGEEVCHGLGGRQDNSVENLSYGTRSKNQGEDKKRDGTLLVGEKHPNHKVTVDIVKWIRDNYEPRKIGHHNCKCHKGLITQKEIANKFCIAQALVSLIVNRKIWNDI